MKPNLLLQRLLRRQPAVFTIAITLACSSSPARAATYQWNGATDSDWTNSDNWVGTGSFNSQTITAGPAQTGGSFAHRLNINNGTGNEAVYTTAQGDTIYAGGASARGLVIGSGTLLSGTFRITGGSFSTVGSGGGDVIGNGNGSIATLIIDGGAYSASATLGMGIGGGPNSTLTLHSGSATIPTLSLNNTTGTINLNGGTLALNNVTRANGNNTLNFNGGTLKARIASANFLPDLANTTARIRAGGLIIDTSGDASSGVDITIAEPLLDDPSSPGGGLTKNGPGTLTLTATPTFTGPLAIHAGQLALSSAVPLTLAQAITGAGGLTTAGPVTLTEASSYTGPTQVSSGRLNLAGSLTSDITVATGARIGGEGSTTGNLTLTGASSVSFNPSSPGALRAAAIDATAATVTFAVSGATGPATGAVVLEATAGTIAGTIGANFLSDGRTTLSLSGDTKQLLANYTPGVLVWKGGAASAPTTWDAGTTENWDNGGAPDRFFTGDGVTFNDSTTTLDVIIAAGGVEPSSVTFANHADFYTITGGPIQGTTALTMTGTNEVRLLSANTYSGGTTVTNGTLTANAAQALGSGPINLAAGAILKLSSTANGDFAYTSTPTSLVGAGTVNVALGTGTSTRLFNGDNSAFTGTLNIGTDAFPGAGKAQIQGNLPAAATVNLLENAAIYLTGSNVNHPAAIHLQGGDTGESLGQLRLDTDATWSGPVTLAGDITGTNDGHIGSNAGTGTISGVIGESGGPRTLTKAGGGKIISTAANTYTGPTHIVGGTLNIQHPAGLSGAGTTVASGAALELQGGLEMPMETLELNGQGMNSLGALRSISGNNTWPGPINAAGLARIACDADLLTLTGPISLPAPGVNFQLVLQGNGNIVVDGVISDHPTGPTAITSSANGAGTRTLTQANLHTGITNVNGGTLLVTHPAALGTTDGGTVIAGETSGTGSLVLSGGITIAGEPLTLNGRQGVTIDVPHLVNLTGDNTWTGSAGFNFGGLDYNLESRAGLLTLTGEISGGGTTGSRFLKLSGDGSGLISGPIINGSATVGLVKLSAGTWTLSGTNTYSGDTAINEGTLVLDTGGQLRFRPTANGLTNSISGTGTFTANGAFFIDLATADPTPGNQWQLVNPANLTGITYGETFTVTSSLGALTASGGSWSITQAGSRWTFDPSTGILSVAAAALADYDSWAAGFQLVGGPAADDDADGLSNFTEYAFGLNPTSGASANPISQRLHRATGHFKYTRRATPAATGVTYTYESSPTLTAGSWVPFTPDAETSDNAAPTEEITVDLPELLLAQPTLFIRVRAIKP